jgi:hypothetical protein
LQIAADSAGLAVPVKILKRSSFTRFSLDRRVAAIHFFEPENTGLAT